MTKPISNQEFDRLIYKHIKEGINKDQAYKAVMKLIETINANHKKAKDKEKKITFKEKFQELKGE